MRLRLFGLSLLVPLAFAPACGSDDEGGGGGTGGDSGSGGATAGSGGTGTGGGTSGTGGGTSGTGGGTSGTGGGTSGAGGTTTDAAPPPPPTACEQLTAGCGSSAGDGGASCLATGEGGDEAACMAALEGCADTCGAPLCAELRDLCGPVDPGRGRIHNCFLAGEDDNAAACFERADCIDICTQAPGDAGGGTDGGAVPDGSAEAGPQDAAAG